MYKTFTIPLGRSRAIRPGSPIYNTWPTIGGRGRGSDGGGVVATTASAIRTIVGGSTKADIGNGVAPVPVSLLGPGLGRWARARAISSCAVVQQQQPTKESDLDKRGGGTKTSEPQSPLGRPIGVAAALAASTGGETKRVAGAPTLWDEFALGDRVAMVSGANRGLGLEMALVLIEAGARAVYCVDLPAQPGNEWVKVAEYVKRTLPNGGGRLEYVSADVRDQKRMWKVAEEIGDREGRMDVCVAAAGILKAHKDCLEYPAEEFEEVMGVNTNGVLYTAQAAGRQMVRFGNRGSIILVASMSGTITNKDHAWVSYNTSKSAVLQMARSMACELGPKGIRVNTLSPGYIYTSMTAAYLDTQPELLEKWSKLNPLGRIGRPDEVRGVIAWLASDASTFCTGSDILVSGGHHAW